MWHDSTAKLAAERASEGFEAPFGDTTFDLFLRRLRDSENRLSEEQVQAAYFALAVRDFNARPSREGGPTLEDSDRTLETHAARLEMPIDRLPGWLIFEEFSYRFRIATNGQKPNESEYRMRFGDGPNMDEFAARIATFPVQLSGPAAPEAGSAAATEQQRSVPPRPPASIAFWTWRRVAAAFGVLLGCAGLIILANHLQTGDATIDSGLESSTKPDMTASLPSKTVPWDDLAQQLMVIHYVEYGKKGVEGNQSKTLEQILADIEKRKGYLDMGLETQRNAAIFTYRALIDLYKTVSDTQRADTEKIAMLKLTIKVTDSTARNLTHKTTKPMLEDIRKRMVSFASKHQVDR
jgi:hypothetical protein